MYTGSEHISYREKYKERGLNFANSILGLEKHLKTVGTCKCTESKYQVVSSSDTIAVYASAYTV